MMLLDTTTLAEYLAPATPALQAQAVVDALANPVDVKVYDGAGSVMGSGTMATPWATQAAGVITVAEVTGFAVSASGTPDATWYLRFESGSRWLRGNFGLAGSGQECVWSLPTWVAGQTAIIGTGIIGVPSNAAPSLDGAPSTLSGNAGTAGSYNFGQHAVDPDGDTMTFALVGTSYTGISIHPTTGVLSWTVNATAASRGLTILVTDEGGLTTEWPVTLTLAGPPLALVTYGGSGLDQVSYALDATNGWRTTDDVVPGWEFSYPAQTPPRLSGLWQFGGNNLGGWPNNYPGNLIYKIRADFDTLKPEENDPPVLSSLDVLWDLPAGWAGVQMDMRGSVYAADVANLVTAPYWLAGKGIPTTVAATLSYYDISHSGYYTPYRALITAVADYKPSGETVPLKSHSRLFGYILHGVSASEGEEKGLGNTPANTVATALHAVDKFGANFNKLCWIGEGRSWRDENGPIIEGADIGSRGGFLERFLWSRYTPHETDEGSDGSPLTGLVTRTGQLAEQYYTAGGTAQSDNFYLTVDETFPPIAGVRYFMDEMEAFREGDSDKAWRTPTTKIQHIYRMCMMRGLQMRRNSISVENKDATFNNNAAGVAGAEGLVSPALLKWSGVQLGRRVYDAADAAAGENCEANEAFCLLVRMRAGSYNPLTLGQGFGTNAIHNLERWLTQREVDGDATTPAETFDMDYNPSGLETALTSNPTRATMETQRKGTNIAFRLDSRMRFGSNIAVKITYYDDNAETITLRYTKVGGGTADKTWTNSGTSAPQVRTRTYFISDFSNTDAVNFRLLCSSGVTGFMFMRVIKV